MPYIRVLPENKIIKVTQGDRLLDILIENNIKIPSYCGGAGWCKKCKVKILDKGISLACQTYAEEDLTVELLKEESTDINIQKEFLEDNNFILSPVITLQAFSLQIPSLSDLRSDLERILSVKENIYLQDISVLRRLPTFLRRNNYKGNLVLFKEEIIDIREEELKSVYGIALDIGTTTLVGHILDLTNGSDIDSYSTENPQLTYGADIISRINFIIHNPEGLQILRDKLIKAITEIIQDLCIKNNISLNDIYAISIAGNSVMTHIFLGVTPENIAFSPFVPAFRNGMIFNSKDIFGNIFNAKLYVFPLISGYVGGDVVAGIIATNLLNEKGNVMLIDIGTNGEIVLKSEDTLFACATAAGPAFEGSNISHGMIAKKGAISHVWLEETVKFEVIGDMEEKGICGSGLLDAISVMLDLKIIDHTGKFMKGGEFYIGKVKITQKDVREFQLVKSALRAGIEVLLNKAGIIYKEIDKIYIAGSFGSYLNRKNAIKTGLLPHIPLEKIILVGNSAIGGAKIVLLNRFLMEDVEKIKEKVNYVELSSDKKFQEYFIKFMYFEEEDQCLIREEKD
uniref:DUF4445 domain-containing protein n=1 Tax=Dictyoglomus thermophilum TaxID=14 RepID=A0A7C3RJC6_DICTH